jgi:RNA polymerase sigma-70 factor (ECF subfamily)
MFSFKPSYNKSSDEQLVSLMIAGDSAAFNQLYQRYGKRLLYYFYRMLGNSNEKAQDFLQEIFVKVIDKAELFDQSRKFSTWIFSIAHNMCKNEYRRLEIRKESEIDVVAECLYEEEEADVDTRNIDMEDFTRDLFEELDTFEEMHKTVFLLHYREGFSIRDIGQVLEISEGTVKSRLFYTRKRLAERLVKYQQALNN